MKRYVPILVTVFSGIVLAGLPVGNQIIKNRSFRSENISLVAAHLKEKELDEKESSDYVENNPSEWKREHVLENELLVQSEDISAEIYNKKPIKEKDVVEKLDGSNSIESALDKSKWEKYVPEVFMPKAPISEEEISEESTSEESISEEPTPTESTPAESNPEESIPEESTPAESTPTEPIPEESIPKESIPEEPTPAKPIQEESTSKGSTKKEPVSEEPISEEPISEEPEIKKGFVIDEKGMIQHFYDGDGMVFDGCLTLPSEGCRGIYTNAFQSYAGDDIYEISIPSNIVDVEPGAFTGLDKLEWIDAEDGRCKSQDGVLFDGTMKELLAFPQARSGIYQIPESVEEIADYAFDSTQLRQLNILNMDVVTCSRLAFENAKESNFIIRIPTKYEEKYKMMLGGCDTQIVSVRE